jgi:hypothetical protein
MYSVGATAAEQPCSTSSCDFWLNNIISWFAMAEGQFVLRGTNDELIRYYNILSELAVSGS